jgi:hypothetical protein
MGWRGGLDSRLRGNDEESGLLRPDLIVGSQ